MSASGGVNGIIDSSSSAAAAAVVQGYCIGISLLLLLSSSPLTPLVLWSSVLDDWCRDIDDSPLHVRESIGEGMYCGIGDEVAATAPAVSARRNEACAGGGVAMRGESSDVDMDADNDNDNDAVGVYTALLAYGDATDMVAAHRGRRCAGSSYGFRPVLAP